MKTMYSRQIKGTAVGMALVLLCGPMPRALAQQASESPLSASANPANGKAEPVTVVLPDSPGAVHSALFAQARPEPEPNSVTPSEQQTGTPQNFETQNAVPIAESDSSGQASPTSGPVAPPASGSVASQPPQRPHEPVGTAAAESVAVTGVAASRPAGAAVAPAKTAAHALDPD